MSHHWRRKKRRTRRCWVVCCWRCCRKRKHRDHRNPCGCKDREHKKDDSDE